MHLPPWLVLCFLFNVQRSTFNLFICVRALLLFCCFGLFLFFSEIRTKFSLVRLFFSSIFIYFVILFGVWAISLNRIHGKPAHFSRSCNNHQPWKCNDIYMHMHMCLYYVHRTYTIYRIVSHCLMTSTWRRYEYVLTYVENDLARARIVKKNNYTVVVYPFFSLILGLSRCCFLCM